MENSLKELEINNEDIYLLIKDTIKLACFIKDDLKNINIEIDNIYEKMS